MNESREWTAASEGEREPLVSVVVACCNRPGYARDSIASVLGQSYRNIEVVVQDDSTTAEVEEVVAGLGDPRIRYHRNRPGKQGAGRNSIAGYRRAQGEYISTLNDDDLYRPEYLATMVAALERHPECVLAFCDHTVIDADGTLQVEETEENTRRWGRDRLREGVVAEPQEIGLIRQSVTGQFAVLRRSELDLNDFPVEVSTAYDYWLIYLALRGGRPAFYSPHRMTEYRVHTHSETAGFADPQEMLRSVVFYGYINERMLADPRMIKIHSQLLPRQASVYASEGMARLRLGQPKAALAAFRRSLRLSISRRAMAGLVLCAVPNRLAQRFIGR